MQHSRHSLKNYLTQAEREEAHQAFRIFDQDGSGAISIREFGQILKNLGQNLSEEQLQELVKSIDKDGNGFIEFNQFLELVAPKIIENRSERVYLEAYKILDESDDGEISKEELMRANYITKAGLNHKEIKDIIAYVEANYSGKFNFNTTLKMLLRQPKV